LCAESANPILRESRIRFKGINPNLLADGLSMMDATEEKKGEEEYGQEEIDCFY
jgi:hypothetical protein